MNIAEQAFNEIFPEKEITHELSVKYNNKFKPYNANVRYTNRRIQFNLSKKWKTVSKEIRIGLLQSLMLKIFKEKKETVNIEFYNSFMRNIHLAVPKLRTDALLEESFNRVNEKYFYGLIERPNLVWGNSTTSKLGSYEYGSDTITISRIFKNEDSGFLDYVMYHEMLHKKHKFYSKNGRSYHHTSEFRKKEKEFENSKELEKDINMLAGRKRIRKKAGFLRFLIS